MPETILNYVIPAAFGTMIGIFACIIVGVSAYAVDKKGIRMNDALIFIGLFMVILPIAYFFLMR